MSEELAPASPAGEDAVMALTVVLADDTPEILFLLRVGLEVDGRFTVVGEATNGLEAIAQVEAHAPDAILLDLAMPIMDGLSAIPKIREASPSTRIVILTAFDAAQMQEDAIGRGAHAYIEKGAEVEEIAEKIARVCAD
jgi:DNA-binding NarL/FixJ family response regulator